MLPSANSVLTNHEKAPYFSASCARTLTMSPHRKRAVPTRWLA